MSVSTLHGSLSLGALYVTSSFFSSRICTLSAVSFPVCENSAQFKSSSPHLADKKEEFGANDVPRIKPVDPWLSSFHLRKQICMSGEPYDNYKTNYL